MTLTPTRHVDNVVITTKGLLDRNVNILDGTTVENKGKLIRIVGSETFHVVLENRARRILARPPGILF